MSTSRSSVAFRVASATLGVLAALFLFSGTLQAQTFAPVADLAFTKVFAGADPLPQVLNITSPGTAFNFQIVATTSSGGAWLSTSNSGCCFAMPRAVSVTVTTTPTMAVGTYDGQIVFTKQGGATSITVHVTLTVTQGVPFFDNLPGSTSFTMKTGSTSITSQDIQVRNGGTGTLTWTMAKSTSDGGNWLTVSSTGGPLLPRSP